MSVVPVKFSEEFKRYVVATVLTQGPPQNQVFTDLGIETPPEVLAATPSFHGA